MQRIFKALVFLFVFLAIGLLLTRPAGSFVSANVPDTAVPAQQSFTTGQAVSYALSPPARDLGPDVGGLTLEREINPRHNPLAFEPDMGQRGTWDRDNVPTDPLIVYSQNSNQTPGLDFDFEGTGNPTGCGSCSPPDTVGDVGLNHYIHMVNATKVAIFDKAGTLLNTPFDLGSLWTSGNCTGNAGDPIVLYDSLADRWLLSQFAFSSHMCIAISQTADPLGSYHLYTFNVGSFPDYFKFGVWPDAYYMSANESSYTAYAFDRAKMLTGDPTATFQKFTGQSNLLLPADVDGPTPPPVGAPGLFYTFKDDSFHGGADRLELFALDVDWVTPGNTTFTLINTIPITSYTYTPCGFFNFNCLRQQGTAQRLDAIAEWPMFRFPYRNFGAHQALVGNFTIGGGAGDVGAAIRWFELRNDGSGWALYQEGTHDPGDGHDRAVGSIAMDQAGNIALGYTVSSSTMFPAIRYATRLASDPLGTLQAEAVLINGSGAQTASNRWGDYSAMGIDPANDCSFWYTNEYYQFSSANREWKTRVGVFTIPGCEGPDFTVTAVPPSQQVCIPNDATYTVDIDTAVGYSEIVALSASGFPSGATAEFSVNNQPVPYTSTLTIGNTGAAAPGDYSIDIAGMGPTSTHTVTVQLNLCAPEIEVDPTSVSSTQQTDTVVTHTLTISNTGTGTLDWTINEYAPSTFMHNLTVQPYEEEVETAVNLTPRMQAFLKDKEPPQDLQPMGLTECIGGMAGSYPCHNVDLLAFLPLANIGGGNGNDSWGWTGCGGREFALMGRTSGTSFVEITDPVNPIYLGNLPTHTSNSTWRDIKTYSDHAFIVSEASGHGMQVFNLNQLCNIPSPPVTFSNSAHYNGFGNAHNIVINEDSGYAYGVGTSTCSGGLHMVNIQNPLSPTNAGCFSADGYTHDAQCVIYNGPDTQHQGKEICFNSNTDTLTIVDVTNKANPLQLSRTGYTGSGYTHQGWLTEDQVYFLLDDELDEQQSGHNTRTYVWNVSNIDAPVLIGNYTSTIGAIDHNQYVRGNYVFQANYRGGLRILDINDVANANLFEEGYFDIYPASNSASFNGAWSTYPYFDSGVVIISGIEQGLFIVQPTSLPNPNPVPCETPANIPWLSVSPASGSTAEGDSTAVDVIFDSTGLTPGEYTASLCIGSNALTTPELFVPVSLTVAPPPEIMITSPLSGTVLTAVNGTNISTTITVTTPNFTIPDDGHWHLWVDGVDTGPVYDYTQSVTLTLGTHVISAQLQYPDHTPVGPVDSIQVEVLDIGITILSPADGAVLTATNGVNISTTVTVTTPNFTIPDDGHWHLWLNGVDTGPVYGASTTITLTVGTHIITAQLQAPDHTPLGPVDTITVTVVAEPDGPMYYLYLPVIVRDE